MKKAQISFVEYIVSFSIFAVFVTYMFFRILNYMPVYSNEIRGEQLKSEAYQLSEVLVNDPGEPIRWGMPFGCPAGWWDNCYLYRQRLSVTNNDVNPLSNYQLRFVMDTASLAGKVQANGDDLRVLYLDGSNWVELGRALVNFGSTNTEIWFETHNDIPPVTTDGNYYIYYGCPTAINPPTSTSYSTLSNTVAWWHFDESNDIKVFDSSLENNNGIFYGESFNDGRFMPNFPGDAPAKVDGRFGKALKFDGVNDYVRVPASNSLNITRSMTIEAWINISSWPTTYPRIVSKETGIGANPYFLGLENSSRSVLLCINTTSAISQQCFYSASNSVSSPNTWYHIAGTWNGTHVQIYINGVQSGGTTATNGNVLRTTTRDVIIGNNPTNARRFNGTIDEIRIFNRSLTQSEIQSEMASSRPIDRSVATWSFEDSDMTGYANDTHIWVRGVNGPALIFDGRNDYVRVPNDETIDFADENFTVGVWMKGSRETGLGYFFSKNYGGPGIRWYGCSMVGTDEPANMGKIRCYVDDGINMPLPETSLRYNDSNWHYAILRRDVTSNTVKIFVDGVERATTADTAGSISNMTVATINNFIIGARADRSSNRWFNGTLDEMRIWNKSLSNEEIQYEYSRFSAVGPSFSSDSEESCAIAPSTTRRIGLSDVQNSTNIVSLSKIDELNTACQGNGYYDVKKLMGVEKDFYLILKERPSGDLLLSCHPPATVYRGINVSVDRFVVINGTNKELGELIVQMW